MDDIQIIESGTELEEHGRISGFYVLVLAIFLAVITWAIISAFEWLSYNLLNSQVFTLKEVSVCGNSLISSTDILDASGLRGCVETSSIYSIMCHTVEKRIRAKFRYLKQVEVKRKLVRGQDEMIYGVLTINVRERQPVALVTSGIDANSFVVVDTNGFLLEEVNADLKSSNPYADMLVVVGIDKMALKSNSMSNALNLALDVLTNARTMAPELYNEILYIDANNPDNIMLHLHSEKSTPEVIARIASDRIKEALKDIMPVIARLREENKHTKNACSMYVDARFPGAVYCR